MPALSPILWHDPDVRWLTGVHEASGHTYFVKESFEELIWWLQLPVLSKLAGQAVPDRRTIVELSRATKEALEAAAAAAYRLDVLLESTKESTGETTKGSTKPHEQDKEKRRRDLRRLRMYAESPLGDAPLWLNSTQGNIA